jgi:hypothetical protein
VRTPWGRDQAAQYVEFVKEMINRGVKGAIDQTLNPLPDVTAVERVIGNDSDGQGVING